MHTAVHRPYGTSNDAIVTAACDVVARGNQVSFLPRIDPVNGIIETPIQWSTSGREMDGGRRRYTDNELDRGGERGRWEGKEVER